MLRPSLLAGAAAATAAAERFPEAWGKSADCWQAALSSAAPMGPRGGSVAPSAGLAPALSGGVGERFRFPAVPSAMPPTGDAAAAAGDATNEPFAGVVLLGVKELIKHKAKRYITEDDVHSPFRRGAKRVVKVD